MTQDINPGILTKFKLLSGYTQNAGEDKYFLLLYKAIL